jgi:hypothetical protein
MKKLSMELLVSQSIQKNFCSMTLMKDKWENAYMELKQFQSEQSGRLFKLIKDIHFTDRKCDKIQSATFG